MNNRLEDAQPHTPIYRVTLYLAAPGTLVKREGQPDHASTAGHAYYSISDGSEQVGYGFSPIKTGVIGPGRVVKNEQDYYQDPAYARTMEITQVQYDRLKEYGEAGYDKNNTYFNLYYKGANNSCVDFVWKGLNYAGLHTTQTIHTPPASPTTLALTGTLGRPAMMPGAMSPPLPMFHAVPLTDFEGKVKVLDNIEAIRQIHAPIPNSKYNQEVEKPLPEKQTWLQERMTEATPMPGLQLPPVMSDPAHPAHHSYQKALDAVNRMEHTSGITPGPHSEKLAAAVAVKVEQDNIRGSIALQMGDQGQLNIVERGFYANQPEQHYRLDTSLAMSQSLEQHATAWNQARSPYYANQASATAERNTEQQQALQQLSANDRALFDGYRSQMPTQITDEQVFKVMLQGREQAEIHRAEQLGDVSLRGEKVFVTENTNVAPSRAVIDLSQPTPSMRESLEQNQGLNQQLAQQQAVDAQSREQQDRQTHAVRMS